MRATRSGYVFGVVALLPLLALLVGAPPAEAVDYGAIRVAGSEKPGLYLEFKGKELRMAASLDGLASARPVTATKMNSYEVAEDTTVITYQFPEVDLPITVKGASSARAQFSLDRFQQTGRPSGGRASRGVMTSTFSAQCRVVRKGAGDATWTYVFFVNAPTSSDRNQLNNQLVTFPGLGKVSLSIETKIEGKKARIGLRAALPGRPDIHEQIALQEVQKNGKPAPATLEVTDANGKVVHTQKGDLKKFGFT